MKQNVIITAGPTNERIDSVMKITNMSTGALGCVLADTLLDEKSDEINKIFYIYTTMSYRPRTTIENIEFITIESTKDLIDALMKIFSENRNEDVIHSTPVGHEMGN